MKLLKSDESLLKELPKIFGLIDKYFPSKEVNVFLFLNKDKINYLVLFEDKGLLIDEKDHRYFQIDHDTYFYLNSKDYLIKHNGAVNFINSKTKDEYRIDISLIDYDPMYDEFNGELGFAQYKDNDSCCEIVYNYLVNENEEHRYLHLGCIGSISTVCLEKNYSKNRDKSFGFVSSNVEYYILYNYEYESFGYYLYMIKKYGLRNNIDSLRYEGDTIDIFRKADLIINGQYNDFLGEMVSYNDVMYRIEDRSFCKEIPKEIVSLYNDNIAYVDNIAAALLQARHKEESYSLKLHK